MYSFVRRTRLMWSGFAQAVPIGRRVANALVRRRNALPRNAAITSLRSDMRSCSSPRAAALRARQMIEDEHRARREVMSFWNRPNRRDRARPVGAFETPHEVSYAGGADQTAEQRHAWDVRLRLRGAWAQRGSAGLPGHCVARSAPAACCSPDLSGPSRRDGLPRGVAEADERVAREALAAFGCALQ